jgi:hypothetical protein
MNRAIILMAAMAFATAAVGTADAQKLDANGKCHAADGKFAKAEVCAHMKAPMHCRNDKGKFAKCGSPGAHPG